MEWIKCSERLPEIGVAVLTYSYFCISVCKIDNFNLWWFISMNGFKNDRYPEWTITHWQPLPLPPKEEQEEPC